MKCFRLLLILSIGFFSCSGPACDCDLLFKNKDSIVSISASKNPEVQKLIAKKYSIQNNYSELVLKDKKMSNYKTNNIRFEQMSADEQLKYYENEIKANELKKKLIALKLEEHKIELDLFRILRFSLNRTEELKVIPYSGTCFKIGAKNEVYYEAEYEDGKLVSEEWIK